ncbi:Putative myc-type, basic helix-loop-helix (bHLH) domain-containing protein [Septoria linicola]|uniref:Myc-type, basic helix-loop-helix (BHLH) domain-containing protein n=1 Tax=Septoria linicola TaxID=215465 RepID=A0A9Q9AEM2_9PEZI|nr:Putative myc-type, basic helix-loop-helix (bHLH) domain-containing protein [Septoria linicola]
MDNPYQHGQQPPTIDMLAVYGGAKEFSGDGFSFDMSQVPPSGQPLLSGTEQNLITDFFAHPDDFSEHVAFGYYKAPSASDGNSNVNGPALQTHLLSHAIANTSHDGSLQYTNTFNPNNDRNNNRSTNTFSAGDINGMATYTREAMSQNDVAAATTLSGFRNNPPTDSATPFALDGASWGAMSMSGLITDAAAETHASNDRQWLHNSAPRPNNEASQPRDSNGNLIEMVMGDMQRGTYAAPPSQNGQGSRPFGTYGSDTNFSSGNFAGTAAAGADHIQKTGNLLGIPLLAQAAESSPEGRGNGDNLSVRTSQVHSGQSNYSPQFTPQYSAAWNSAVVGPHSGPHKRRKSNSANGVKQEPNSEDDEAGANPKRRKSMANGYQPTQAQIYTPSYSQMPPPPMQYSQGPMMLPPQDMRRPPTRKKENLTDDQKRANHIVSEKKRREIINQGYRDLNELTPALAMGKSGLSRSECLTEINNYLYALQLANTRLIKDLQLEPSAFALPAPTSQSGLY